MRLIRADAVRTSVGRVKRLQKQRRHRSQWPCQWLALASATTMNLRRNLASKYHRVFRFLFGISEAPMSEGLNGGASPPMTGGWCVLRPANSQKRSDNPNFRFWCRYVCASLYRCCGIFGRSAIDFLSASPLLPTWRVCVGHRIGDVFVFDELLRGKRWKDFVFPVCEWEKCALVRLLSWVKPTIDCFWPPAAAAAIMMGKGGSCCCFVFGDTLRLNKRTLQHFCGVYKCGISKTFEEFICVSAKIWSILKKSFCLIAVLKSYFAKQDTGCCFKNKHQQLVLFVWVIETKNFPVRVCRKSLFSFFKYFESVGEIR